MKKYIQANMNKIKQGFAWIMADKKRTLISVLVLSLIVFGIYKIVVPKKTSQQFQTDKVEKGTIIAIVSASGKVLTTNTLSITSEASGVVKAVYVKDEDKVWAGQTLAEITLDSAGSEKNAQAYASLVSAQNGVNSARNSYRSAQATVEKVLDEVKGHDKDETFSQKETRTKAEVGRDNAWDQIKSAEANLASAEYNYRSTSPTITAPFSGVIESVAIVPGMVLESSSSTTSINSQRVAIIKGDSLPVVSVSLSEVDVPKVKVGQKATITLDSINDKTFTGKVATVDRIGSTTNNVTSYNANIKLDTISTEILPNMSATANIIITTKDNVLLVPSTAIITQAGQTLAKTLKNGQQENVEVATGLTSETQTEIITGLSEGETVITGTISTTTQGQSRSVFGGFGGSFRMMR